LKTKDRRFARRKEEARKEEMSVSLVSCKSRMEGMSSSIAALKSSRFCDLSRLNNSFVQTRARTRASLGKLSFPMMQSKS
jgi:hypothetical protein